VLPKGLHRIPPLWLFANGHRAANIARARELLAVPSRPKQPERPRPQLPTNSSVLLRPCLCCGGRMIIIETFARGYQPKHHRRPLQKRSGSTPHDTATTPPPIQQPSDARHSGWLGQHSRRLLQVDKSARNDTANPVRHRPRPSCGPSPKPILRGEAIGAGALSNLPQPDAAAKSP
jgi:hypothetical protein